MPKMSYRWTVLIGLLFSISMVNFGDRAALGAVVPLLVHDYNFTPKQLGWILSAFGFGYCAMQLFGSGALVRWLQPRRLTSGMAILWSILIGLLSLATTGTAFFILRALFGLAEGTVWVSFETLISRWYGRFETQRAFNVCWAGISASAILVPPLAAMLGLAFTWRGPFLVLAAVGVLLGAAFWMLVDDFPENSRFVSPAESRFLRDNRVVPEGTADARYDWRTVLTNRCAWWAAVASFATAYQTYMLLAWLPEYLVHYRHISYLGSGFLTALPFVAGATGVLSAAALSDVFHKRGRIYLSRTAIPACCALFGGIAFIAIAFTSSTQVLIALLMLAAFCNFAANGVLAALAIDIFPFEPHVGTQFIVGFGSLNAIFAPLVTGFIVARTDSFVDAFLVGGAPALVMGILLLLFFRIRAAVPDRAGSQVAAGRRSSDPEIRTA